jgi:secondary thiamine-phosphate synthase enzyme
MIKRLSISTRSRCEFIDITSEVRRAVRDSNAKAGVCHIFVPHTTAGVTINENADPSVQADILGALEKSFPANAAYRHTEGNAAAHVKSSLVGAAKTLLVEDGDLVLGTWQGIFFCEFDGPRRRNVLVRVGES